MSIVAAFNWIDWLLVAGTAFFMLEGWHAGFVQLISGLIAYAGAIWLSIRYHKIVGDYISRTVGVPFVWSTIIGYILIALVVQIAIGRLLILVFRKLGRKIMSTRIDNVLGSLVSAFNFLAIMAFLLMVLLNLPLSGRYKDDIRTSFIGRRLVDAVEHYGGSVTSSLKEVTDNTIQFMTVKPQSQEMIKLDIKPQAWELSVDENAERKMLEQVNAERIKVGAVPLSPDAKLTEVARAHSRDMLIRRYFSHNDPEGHDLKYRLDQAQISYSTAGENLAYAPNVTVAMQGLLQSEGHRKNMLDPTFAMTGIGVIDAGVYGKMFTEIFISQPFYFYHSP